MIKLKKILFENISTKQIIFKNTFWITCSEFIARLIKYVLIVFVIRKYGAFEYGKFAYAFSIVSLFGLFFDLGLSLVVTREIAKNPSEQKHFSAIVFLKICLGIVTSSLIITLAFFMTSDWFVLTNVIILALYLFMSEISYTFFAFFRAKQKMEYEGWASLLQSMVLIIIGFAVVLKSDSIIGLSYAYIASALIPFIIMFNYFYLKKYTKKIVFDVKVIKHYLYMSWPLALVGGLTAVCNNTDSVMLGSFGQIKETGIYNAINKIVGFAIIPMNLVIQGIYPALSSSVQNKEKLQKTWNFQNETMIVVVLPMLVGGITLAPQIIKYLYGEAFLEGVFVMKTLLVSAAFIYLYISLNQALIVCNQQRKLFIAVLFGALINVLLNYLLIPKFSMNGASIATAASNICILAGMIVLTVKYTPIIPFSKRLLQTILVSSVACLFMYLLLANFKTNLILVVGLSIALYSVCYFILKMILYKIYEY